MWEDQVTFLKTTWQLNTNTSLLVVGSEVRFTGSQGRCYRRLVAHKQEEGETGEEKEAPVSSVNIERVRRRRRLWGESVDGGGWGVGFPPRTCCTCCASCWLPGKSELCRLSILSASSIRCSGSQQVYNDEGRVEQKEVRQWRSFFTFSGVGAEVFLSSLKTKTFQIFI